MKIKTDQHKGPVFREGSPYGSLRYKDYVKQLSFKH